jgi:hypothetical protein
MSLPGFCQYWQQKVDHTIDVTLNDKEKTLDGFERIRYTNHSPDTLFYIWFHLWPNAYKNDRTAFSDQLLRNGNTGFYFSGPEAKGYINRLDFKVDGTTARLEDHPEHIDIAKLVLPKPLPPSGSITITTPFHVKLPFNISRGGYEGESFQATQWYPKPAVYDRKGWHPMPYLDQGEFYSEFGDYDVRITLPSNYVVAATGVLQGEQGDDLRSQFFQGKKLNPDTSYKVLTAKKGSKSYVTSNFPRSSSQTTTLHYKQNRVHDFAWFADKRFYLDHDSLQLPSGRVVHIYNYYVKRYQWPGTDIHPGIEYAKKSLQFYSDELGEFPYDVLSIVEGPDNPGGGMEYPTITSISHLSSMKEFDLTVAHEVGHNWFYGILANNEREHAWMDEGMNSYYENLYASRKYSQAGNAMRLYFMTSAKRRTDQPINTPAANFSGYNYDLVNYSKAAEWMTMVEQNIGTERFRQMMQHYFREWAFRHPYPEDFKAIAKQYLPDDSLFSLLDSKGLLSTQHLSGFTVASPFAKKSIDKYIKNPTKNGLLVSAALGTNYYDRLMVGAMLTNYKLPPSNFSFFLAPFYATGSKSFTGIGKLNYSIHSNKWIRKTDLFLNASTFTMDDFADTAGRKLYMKFRKLVPGIRFTFREKDPRSTVRKSIQWKTFIIKEQFLSIISDTIFTGPDTALVQYYPIRWQGRYVNRLQFNYSNERALYPFYFNLQVDQGTDFLRPAVTANYFFNYADGGGLQFRFFAGKFLYIDGKTTRKQFATDRYHLNMTGPNGYEDYTYSDYFYGRNEFEGTGSQQIMIRDGGFKVRTDLLADKIGKTDDWLTALNFSSSIPAGINPLSVLPVKIPLRVFFDIGTYADAWDRNSDADRFLFDAGLHIPLLREAINIYIPVIYSKVYGDYIKSTIPKNRFLRTISFTINFYNKDLKKLNRNLEF